MSTFTLNVQELRAPHAMHTLSVRWFNSIKDVKDMLHHLTGQPPRNLDLFYGTNPSRLTNNMTLHDFGIEANGHVLRLAINGVTVDLHKGWGGHNSFVLTPSRDVDLGDDCERMLGEVATGLKHGTIPMKTDILDCTGGVYFMRSSNGNKIAVFKPHDEEQGMPNNGKGYEGNGDVSLRPNFRPGQGCIREVAAYIMDVDDFTGVPPTTLVHCEHTAFLYPSEIEYGIAGGSGNSIVRTGKSTTRPFPKLGSLQHFVTSDGTFEDVGSSVISDFEIQKIALFDMRLLNCDRNASNILVSKKRRMPKSPAAKLAHAKDPTKSFTVDENTSSPSQNTDGPSKVAASSSLSTAPPAEDESKDRYLLIPIDHGYSLPTKLDIKEWDWVWFNLPHVKRPVHPAIRDYILNINFDKLIATLTSQVAIAEDSLFLLKLSHNLLVSGIKQGLTLFQIASMIARLDEDEPSQVERAIEVAEENAHRSIELRSFRTGGRAPDHQSPDPPPSSPLRRVDNALDTNTTGLVQANMFSVNDSIGGTVDFKNMTITGSAVKKSMQGAVSGPGSNLQSSYPSDKDASTMDDAMSERSLGSGTNNSSLSDLENMANGFGIGIMDFGYDSSEAFGSGVGVDKYSNDSTENNSINSGGRGNTAPNSIGSTTNDMSPKAYTSNEDSPRSTLTNNGVALANGAVGGQLGGGMGASYGLGVGTNDKGQKDIYGSGVSLMRLASTGGQFDSKPATPRLVSSSLLPNAWEPMGLMISPTHPPASLLTPGSSASGGTNSAHNTPGGPLVRQKAITGLGGALGGLGLNDGVNTSSSPSLPPKVPRSAPVIESKPTGRKRSPSMTKQVQTGSDDCLVGKEYTHTFETDDFGPTMSGKTSPAALKFPSSSTHNHTFHRNSGSGSNGAGALSPTAGRGSQASSQCTTSERATPRSSNSGVGSGANSPSSNVRERANANRFSPLSVSVTKKTKSLVTRRGGSDTGNPTEKVSVNVSGNNTSILDMYADADIDTDADTDTDPEQVSPDEEEDKQAINEELSSIQGKASLQRVASFTAFGSQPLYDLESTERRFSKLMREKRRQQSNTTEFRKLRGHFTTDRVTLLIGRMASDVTGTIPGV
eukprot:GSChrysophyteH2.ASY1.ANO1.854.1 assembled CDS